MRSVLVGLLLLMFSSDATFAYGAPTAQSNGQMRAYWVDAFGDGIGTEAQIDELVNATAVAHMNAIIAQIGRRGDCFCNRATMPRTEAGIQAYPFDPLQTLIDKAHARGIEVHAWVIATAIWNSATPPHAADHVFNTHGPTRQGRDNWLLTRWDGASRAGDDFYLDPGHPDAADYIVRMVTSLVANYDIDGVNLDRIRYPDHNLGNEPSWGYNPVAVARFQEAAARSDVPMPTDPVWTQWRRDQITSLVRRIYLETYTLKPWVRVSADTIVYGHGPQSPDGWTRSAAYSLVLQDWQAWLREGILDMAIPMNYKQEGTSQFSDTRQMYDEWSTFAKDHQFNRHVAVGSALYLNSVSGSLQQIRRALEPSAAGNVAAGWVGYSYRAPDARSDGGTRPPAGSRAELARALTQRDGSGEQGPAMFEVVAPMPSMPWKTVATTGHALGILLGNDTQPVIDARVDLYAATTGAWVATQYSGSAGRFGFVDVAPGSYVAVTDDPRTGRRDIPLTITAGTVATTVSLPH